MIVITRDGKVETIIHQGDFPAEDLAPGQERHEVPDDTPVTLEWVVGGDGTLTAPR
jgi:hypothetical protein